MFLMSCALVRHSCLNESNDRIATEVFISDKKVHECYGNSDIRKLDTCSLTTMRSRSKSDPDLP